MATIPVDVHRKQYGSFFGAELDLRADIERAKMLAKLFDSEFEIAGIRFGLDALIGLLPVLGDTITTLAGTYPIYIARKHKLGKAVEWRMMANLAVDYVGGIIPVVGDLFDVAFKANLKNVALLEKAAAGK
jgi:hypothetical protein